MFCGKKLLFGFNNSFVLQQACAFKQLRAYAMTILCATCDSMCKIDASEHALLDLFE